VEMVLRFVVDHRHQGLLSMGVAVAPLEQEARDRLRSAVNSVH